MIADGDMPDLIAINNIQHIAGFYIATLRHFCTNTRRDIQTARFQYPRHQSHAQQGVVSGFIRHIPQMPVRFKIAVIVAQAVQTATHQAEVEHFFFRHPYPIANKLKRHIAKTICRIQSQINCIKSNVRNRVQHGRIAFDRIHLARRNLRRCNQTRTQRMSGKTAIHRFRLINRQTFRLAQLRKQGLRQSSLFIRIVRQQSLFQ